MPEPDRTNADAERVSDSPKPVAWQCEFFRADPSPRWVREIWFSDPRDIYGPTLVRNVHALVSADIIEAQSKALAEARADAIKDCAAVANHFGERWKDAPHQVPKAIVDANISAAIAIAKRIRACALLTPTPENPNG